MKKGFTLIELLAVIVILAIIALIATPIVLNIINDTKESAVLRSAEFYMDAIELSIAQATLKNQSIQDGTYQIMSNGNICIGTYNGTTCTGDEMKVEVNGEAPNGGMVVIKGGEIAETALNIDSKPVVYYSYLSETKILEGGEWIVPEDTCFTTQESSTTGTGYFASFQGYAITGYTCDYKNIIIPSTIGNNLITAIGPNAFEAKGLNNVFLPETVIGFAPYSFKNNNLTTFVIRPSVTLLAGPVLAENSKLETIVNGTGRNLEWSNIFAVSVGTFDYGQILLDGGRKIDIIGLNGETGLTYATCFATTLSSTYDSSYTGVTIGAYTCTTTDIVIPSTTSTETITGIYNTAFTNKNLTSIILPETLEYTFGPIFANNPNLTKIVNTTDKAFNWAFMVKPSTLTQGATPFKYGKMIINVNGEHYMTVDVVGPKGERGETHTYNIEE